MMRNVTDNDNAEISALSAFYPHSLLIRTVTSKLRHLGNLTTVLQSIAAEVLSKFLFYMACETMNFFFLGSFYFYSTTTRCVNLCVSDSVYVVHGALQTPLSGAKMLIIM